MPGLRGAFRAPQIQPTRTVGIACVLLAMAAPNLVRHQGSVHLQKLVGNVYRQPHGQQ